MKDAKNRFAFEYLAQGLSAVTARMEAKDATTATAQAATILLQAMKDGGPLPSLAQGLSAVATRMEPQDAAKATSRAAIILVQAMKDTKDPAALTPLARGLLAVGARLEVKEAVQVATILVQAMKGTRDEYLLHSLADGLEAVAASMDPEDAAQAATTLVQAIKDNKDPDNLAELAWGLSAVAARMEANEAATSCAQAATSLVQVMKDNTNPFVSLDSCTQGLSALLSAGPPVGIRSRSATAASAVAFPAGSGQPLTALALFIPAAELPSCRLSTQQLVELLKMPTCIGKARRVVLDQLGNRYRRTFADVWEFVRFAKEQNLDLDFTTPPQRPEGSK